MSTVTWPICRSICQPKVVVQLSADMSINRLLIFHRYWTATCVLLTVAWQYFTWVSEFVTSSEHEAFRIFEVDQKKDEIHITYTSGTDSLSFWPIYQWQSTEIPLTINGQRISRVLATISTKISANSRPVCRPSLRRYLGWYIGWYVNWHISVVISAKSQSTHRPTLSWCNDWDISVECWPICRPIHQSSVGRYVDPYIGRGVRKIHMIRWLEVDSWFKVDSWLEVELGLCLTSATLQLETT